MAHGWRRIGRVVLRAHQQGEAVDLGIYLGGGGYFLLGFIAYLCQRFPAPGYAIFLRIAGRIRRSQDFPLWLHVGSR
jgi:hypothetical protein